MEDAYKEDIEEQCNTNKILLSLIIFAPALIGFVILGIRIYLDKREANQLDQDEQDALNTRKIINSPWK